jgi:hypothetical protein
MSRFSFLLKKLENRLFEKKDVDSSLILFLGDLRR